MKILRKIHFWAIAYICLLTLPASAQTNPRALQKALYDGTQYLFHPNYLETIVNKTITLKTLSQKIAVATTPSMYIFPMQLSVYSAPQQKLKVGLSLPPQTDLIPGATFRPYSSLRGVTYSGTIFKDGDDIFGIVPTHTLRWKTDIPFETLLSVVSLPQKFNLEMYDKYGQAISLQGEIVQLGAMQDISLVKFRPEDEKKLSPLSLRAEEPTDNMHLHLQGFNQDHQLIHLAGLSVFRTTPTFMQIRVPGNTDQRMGLCGSPVLDRKGLLAGVLIGQRPTGKRTNELDIGYVAPLSSIKTVLEAYRNGGKATFPLQLNGQTIMKLGVDEWIQRIYLFDEYNDFVWGSGPIKKFSYQQTEEKINELKPAHMVMDIFKIAWTPNGELQRIPLKQTCYSFSQRKIAWEHYEK